MPKFNYVALAIGVFMAIAGAYLSYYTLDFLHSSVTAEGVVVATPFGRHHPSVAFTAANGEKVEFPGNGIFASGHKVGERVRVRYLPNAPGSAKLDETGCIWDGTILILAMALLWIVCGLCNVPFRRWGPRE